MNSHGLNLGGGGERVLWCIIKAIELHTNKNPDKSSSIECVVYTSASPKNATILNDVKSRFGIEYSGTITIRFIELKKTYFLEAQR